METGNLKSQATCDSWAYDFQHLLSGVLKGGSEELQKARLNEYLEARYAPEIIPYVFDSLHGAYNHLARNWQYFTEIGLIENGNERFAVTNALILALYDSAMATPSPELLIQIDPIKIVKIAQRHIDRERSL